MSRKKHTRMTPHATENTKAGLWRRVEQAYRSHGFFTAAEKSRDPHSELRHRGNPVKILDLLNQRSRRLAANG